MATGERGEATFSAEEKAAIKKLGAKRAKRYEELRTAFQQQGDEAALEAARELLSESQNLPMGDRERLFGYLEGGGKVILPEPHALHTEVTKLTGLDGRKMSKSYGNTIALRDDAETVSKKIRTMQSPVHLEAFKAFGANATPLSYNELYGALQTGVVDGAEAANTNYWEKKFYEEAEAWRNR